MDQQIQAPAVYVDRGNHTTIVIYVGRKYVAHIEMDSKLRLTKTRFATFEQNYRLLDYPASRAANKFLEATHLPTTDVAKKLLQKVAASSEPVTEEDLIEQVEEEDTEMAKKTTAETAAPASKISKAAKTPAAKEPALKVVKAPKEKAPAAEGGGRRAKYFDEQKITAEAKENPFKSTLGERFQLILDGKTPTVGAYMKATSRYGDLGFFEKKGVITIR